MYEQIVFDIFHLIKFGYFNDGFQIYWGPKKLEFCFIIFSHSFTVNSRTLWDDSYSLIHDILVLCTIISIENQYIYEKTWTKTSTKIFLSLFLRSKLNLKNSQTWIVCKSVWLILKKMTFCKLITESEGQKGFFFRT